MQNAKSENNKIEVTIVLCQLGSEMMPMIIIDKKINPNEDRIKHAKAVSFFVNFSVLYIIIFFLIIFTLEQCFRYDNGLSVSIENDTVVFNFIFCYLLNQKILNGYYIETPTDNCDTCT